MSTTGKPDKRHRPWTPAEFKRLHAKLFPGYNAQIRRSLLKVFNAAIDMGLTRDEVLDAWSTFVKSYPDELPWGVFFEELLGRADAVKGGPLADPANRPVKALTDSASPTPANEKENV